jgi:hypothetical protein
LVEEDNEVFNNREKVAETKEIREKDMAFGCLVSFPPLKAPTMSSARTQMHGREQVQLLEGGSLAIGA